MKLEFRHYKPRDDAQIADLFNRAFHVMIPKTPEGWAWKYTHKPNFDPRGLQVCEDVENHKIVGFIASEVAEYLQDGKIIKCGRINDVSTDPEYQKNGIARKLLAMANEYFQKKEVEFSFLSANPRDHPRKKLYMPDGYKDIISMKLMLKFLNLTKLCFSEAPILIPLYPFAIGIKIIMKSLKFPFQANNKERKKINKYVYIHHINKDNKEEMKTDPFIQDFFTAYNQISSKMFQFAENRTPENWYWRRFDVPNESFYGSFLSLKNKSGEIVAGASISIYQTKIRILKTSANAMLSIIHECFIDEDKLDMFSEEISIKKKKIINIFINSIINAAKSRNSTVSIYFTDKNSKYLNGKLKIKGFTQLPGGAWMMKKWNSNIITKIEENKPFFIPTYDCIGFP